MPAVSFGAPGSGTKQAHTQPINAPTLQAMIKNFFFSGVNSMLAVQQLLKLSHALARGTIVLDIVFDAGIDYFVR